ncbi:MAG: hypothetical protein ACLKAN_13565 [Alkaliphilus sp.]
MKNKEIFNEMVKYREIRKEMFKLENRIVKKLKKVFSEYDFIDLIESINITEEYTNIYFAKHTDLDKATIDICMEETNAWRFAVQWVEPRQELRLYVDYQYYLDKELAEPHTNEGEKE